MATFILIIAIILRILSNPAGNVFQKQLTNRGHHPVTISFFTYLLLALVCIAFVNKATLPVFGVAFWSYAAMGGLLGALGNGLLVKALQMGDLSVLGPINAYKSVVGIIFGVFVLGEIPGYFSLAGVFLIIYGSYFVLSTGGERFTFDLLRRKDIQYRLYAMVLTAIEAVFIKKIVVLSSPQTGFIMWCWFGALFSFLMLFLFKVNIKNDLQRLPNDIVQYILLAICIGVMQLSTNFVFEQIPVGYALALFQLSIIVSILLGRHIFNEQDIKKKLIGSIIMIAGSVIVILLK